MKPLMLHGHQRALTQIKYNREGDLLFSAAKDQRPNVWYSLNGERLGTFGGGRREKGHQGAVWCIDVDWKTENFLSGAGDSTLKLWDIATGIEKGQLATKSSVRTCAFSYSSNLAVYTTDAAMKQECELFIIDVRNVDESFKESIPILKMQPQMAKITSTMWGPLDRTIITGHEDGTIVQWDVLAGKEIRSIKEHKSTINDMQQNKDGTMFITASKDNTAKLFDTDDLSLLKMYQTDRPVNSASMSPLYDHVVLGGGQEAMEAATTSARVGKFESRFFHLVFEEEFARLKGHFGPINTLAFHPDGKSFASGSEDGFVRLQSFDQSYYDFEFDY